MYDGRATNDAHDEIDQRIQVLRARIDGYHMDRIKEAEFALGVAQTARQADIELHDSWVTVKETLATAPHSRSARSPHAPARAT